MASEPANYRIAYLVAVIFHLRKRAHADCRDVARQHARGFFDVLRLIAIHANVLAVFQTPRPLADIESDAVAAKLIHGDLHRSARAKRRIEKDERDTATRERAFTVVSGLDLRRKVN